MIYLYGLIFDNTSLYFVNLPTNSALCRSHCDIFCSSLRLIETKDLIHSCVNVISVYAILHSFIKAYNLLTNFSLTILISMIYSFSNFAFEGSAPNGVVEEIISRI